MTGVMSDRRSSDQYLPKGERRKEPLKTCVQSALELYFMDLDGHKPEAIYKMVISEVEHAMLGQCHGACGWQPDTCSSGAWPESKYAAEEIEAL